MEQGKRCLYTKLDNGIRVFTYTESSNAAVDECIKWYEYIRDEDPIPPNETIRYMFDTRQSGALPMYYAFKRNNEWDKKYPPDRSSRVAQLYSADSIYVTIAKSFLKVMKPAKSTWEFFQNDQSGAITWLLKND